MVLDPSDLPVDSDKLVDLVERYGSPLYVTNGEIIEERYKEIDDCFSSGSVYYSAKANTNIRILELLKNVGAGLDAVSLGEIVAGEKAGFTKDNMMYTGVNPPEDELIGVVEKNIKINVDSDMELDRLASINQEKEIDKIGVRVDPGIGAGHSEEVVTGGGTKFGVRNPINIYKKAERYGLNPVGIHMHIGSGIVDIDPYIEAIDSLVEIIEKIEKLGIELEYIDIGGGFGVPYRPGDEKIDIEKLSKKIEERYSFKSELIIEPGRYLVADSTVFLTKVNTIKDRFIGVDGGFNMFPRPALYGSYHHITNLSRNSDTDKQNFHIVGPLCESGDILAKDRSLSPPKQGDILGFHTAGAYCFSMASNYNSSRRPPEVLIKNNTSTLIRRRETYEDLFKNINYN